MVEMRVLSGLGRHPEVLAETKRRLTRRLEEEKKFLDAKSRAFAGDLPHPPVPSQLTARKGQRSWGHFLSPGKGACATGGELIQ
ncbi:hypothetical protein COU19_00235 [Candidatus Kaiserbacteria bacterium CG10_big_fil_rev_8_21_14_0_10_56_12]|uniref:Uncharacterized protein n=1 Tax=Candidatus Kaiserbacteria bacterium CG10_big_fil_rev_8_21_14_0_10_56_12 TaxID=1974611 RepID=A0A2H0UAV1_9BACT|nr:MAG: hypothetical protein COU19_00235 [Candidatus Kaiserbacteria bacterium CG10_big_fil_rev_8_21_14_0_10_56_12]